MQVRPTSWRVATMLLSSAAIACAQSTGSSDDVIVRGPLGARADSFLTRAALHGLSGAIVVAHHGQIVLEKGYGLAERSRGTTVEPTTPFFVGSLAKQFTAAAVLRLAADGRLRLDDSLGAFFPAVPIEKRGITVRHLLSHTSGLPYLPTSGLFGGGSRDSVMQEMLAEPVLFPPGERYEYSTPGYILLAGIIERASGETYEKYLRALFERANLRRTGFVGERTRWSASPVRSYSDGSAEDLLEDVPALPRFVGAGSIVSTVGDLYRWYEALLHGVVLPDVQRDLLFAPVVRVRPNMQEALTWLLIDLPTGPLRQAAGDIGGFNAELRHYVDEDLIVVFASNARVRGRGYREIVPNYVARMSRAEAVPFPPEIANVPESRMRSMPGTYTLANGGTLTMWTAGDSLMVGARDSAGISALAAQDSATLSRAGQFTAQAARFLDGLHHDDDSRSFLHASIPTDARVMFIARIRSLLGEAAGAKVTLLGTSIDSPTGARTWVKVARDSTDEIFALVWSGGRVIGMEPGGRAAYPLRLRSEGTDMVTSFDLFTGHLVRVELVSDRELAIESNGVRVRADR